MINRNLRFKINKSINAKTKDGNSIEVDVTVKIKASISLFTWFYKYSKLKRVVEREGVSNLLPDLVAGHLRVELGKVLLEDIDNFKFNLPNAFRKAFSKQLHPEFTYAFVKLESINLELPEGLAEELTEKRKDRNAYLDDILG